MYTSNFPKCNSSQPPTRCKRKLSTSHPMSLDIHRIVKHVNYLIDILLPRKVLLIFRDFSVVTITRYVTATTPECSSIHYLQDQSEITL